MVIENLDTTQLIPYGSNPRKNDKTIDKVAASISQFGFRQPIVIDEKNVIVCGHTRLEAAKKLQLETVPCTRIENLTESQIKAYRILDNKIQESSEWDYEMLELELEELDFDFEPFDVDFEINKNFDNVDVSEQPNLNNIEKKQITCPYCKKNFEC